MWGSTQWVRAIWMDMTAGEHDEVITKRMLRDNGQHERETTHGILAITILKKRD